MANIPFLVPISATDSDGVKHKINNIQRAITEHADTSIDKFALSLCKQNTNAAARACVVASTLSELKDALGMLKDIDIQTNTQKPRLCFMFPGQGSQYHGMAKTLLETHSLFKSHFETVCTQLDKVIRQPIKEIIYGKNPALVNQTEFTQPAIFAVEHALAKTLIDYGVQPELMLGHSVGEYVAATIAHVIDVDAMTQLVVRRGKLISDLPPSGGMLAMMADEKQVEQLLTGAHLSDNDVAVIAVINSTSQTVVAGKKSSLEKIATIAEAKNITVHPVPVSHAFHSPMLAPIVTEFYDLVKSFTYQKPQIPLVSNIDGQIIRDNVINEDYLKKHLVSPVRFYDCMRTALDQGIDTVVELGGNATLTPTCKMTFGTQKARWLSCINRQQDNQKTFFDCLQKLYLAGVDLNWQRIVDEAGGIDEQAIDFS